MNDNKAIYVGIKEDGEFWTAPREQKFLEKYMSKWAETLSTSYFNDESIDTGHKLRPRLVYWGFLAGNPVDTVELDDVADIAVSMELIHKSSLLLDDYIDKDKLRHGRRAFYLEHGVERTIIYSLNLLSTSLSIVNEVIKNYPNNTSMQYISMQGLIKCMYDMSLGVLIELDTKMTDQTSIKDVVKIIDLETSSLIQTSMLLGYYISRNVDAVIEKTLREVGQCVGYAFQLLNDLESVFGATVEEHKGNDHNDIEANRKNYCYAMLLSLINTKEHKALDNGHESVSALFKKYNIKAVVLKEIEACGRKITSMVGDNKSLDENWKTGFLSFYQSVILTYLNRLNKHRENR